MQNLSFLACLEVTENFVVVGGVEHVASMSNLTPSFLELFWVELGLGFDNLFRIIFKDSADWKTTKQNKTKVLSVQLGNALDSGLSFAPPPLGRGLSVAVRGGENSWA